MRVEMTGLPRNRYSNTLMGETALRDFARQKRNHRRIGRGQVRRQLVVLFRAQEDTMFSGMVRQIRRVARQ